MQPTWTNEIVCMDDEKQIWHKEQLLSNIGGKKQNKFQNNFAKSPIDRVFEAHKKKKKNF